MDSKPQFVFQVRRINLPALFAFCAFLLTTVLPHLAIAESEIDDEHKAKNLAVLNYVTGWTLDSAGYHPAVFMLLENTSGRDLSGITIKMQGKFTDIHTLEPSTARLEIRRALKPHQQFSVAIISPKEFELPRDTQYWPVMECKTMARVGNVGDEGTEYLLVTKIDSATATQDDAFQTLNELTSYNRSASAAAHGHNGKTSGEYASATRPLIAKADRIKPLSAVPNGNGNAAGKADIFSAKPLPGLGEDFYNFEKSFGLPVLTDAHKKDFTWAKYKHAGSGIDIVVGSKERTGKVDLISFVLPRSAVKNDQSLIDQCKLFAGTLHNAKFSSASKSVRYLPAGRLVMISSAAPGGRILCMALPESHERPPSYLVMISRLGPDPDELLRSHQAGSDVLKGLPLGD
jgi:DNA-binding transcriptional regulator YdaS (Cro superfamily)